MIYARAGGLLAAPFDLKRLEVTGGPVSVLEGLSMSSYTGAAEFSYSAGGSLAYVPGGSRSAERTLLWLDRKGAAEGLGAPSHAYEHPRLSPDSHQVALGIQGTDPGLWVYELTRGTLTRLVETTLFPYPTWTPDGKRLAFMKPDPEGPYHIYLMPADGSGAPERLTSSENMQLPGSWSPDGQVLAFSEGDPTGEWRIWVLKLEGEHKPQQPFLQTSSNEGGATFSPDGHWLAYVSDESGREEVYVRPFSGPGGKSQISTEGGSEPVWTRNGRELFYRNGDKMMAVAIEIKPTFVAAKPKLLFQGHYETGFYGFSANYDVSPDGQRFLMLKASEQESVATQLNVVLNWSDELRRLVPPGRK